MYADLLFFNELLSDYLILLAVSHILGQQTAQKRIILGALCGAFAATVFALFFVDVGTIFNIAAGIILCFLMVYIAFFPSTRSNFLHISLYTYATAFVMGGIANFITERFPAIPAIIVFLVGFLLLESGIKLASLINKNTAKLCTVRISFANGIKSYTALMDTGNLLYDDHSGHAVSIISKGSLPNFQDLTTSHTISFKSLGCENGTLKIIYVPYMCVEAFGKKKLIENAPLGISEHTLSSSDSYQMIINPEILN